MPFLSQGFRPLFLFAAIWAALSMALWIGHWTGLVALNGPLEPLDWHVHELIFGYGSAVLCGFLLTAIPNWTGRAALSGGPLAVLVALWLLARLGFVLPTGVPLVALTALQLSVPVLFCFYAGREIIAAGNRRNLPVLLMVALFALSNALFLLEVAQTGVGAGHEGQRMGAAILILLISLIGGRITPVFTGNWLKARGIEALPTEFDRTDGIVLALSAAVLAAWILRPDMGLGPCFIAVAGLHVLRLSRWRGWATRGEMLLFGLHLGYGFVPVGLGLIGAHLIWPGSVPEVAGLHAWTIGAIGVMTLTVMTRASLGHSGRALRAGVVERAYLWAALVSALCRIGSVWGPGWLMHLSATLWILAFAAFAIRMAPVMLQPKLQHV